MDTLAHQPRPDTERPLFPPASAAIWRQRTIYLTSGRAAEFIDISDRLEQLVTESGIETGLLNVQTLHTTTAIVLNEHEPLLVQDFESMLEKAAPLAAGYRHDDVGVRTVNLTDGERANGHAHCRALLLGPTACLNVFGGTLQLGRWQRVLFAELDGPRGRLVSVVLFGEGRR